MRSRRSTPWARFSAPTRRPRGPVRMHTRRPQRQPSRPRRPAPPRQRSRSGQRRPALWPWLAGGLGVLLAIGLVAFAVQRTGRPPGSGSPQAPPPAGASRPGCTGWGSGAASRWPPCGSPPGPWRRRCRAATSSRSPWRAWRPPLGHGGWAGGAVVAPDRGGRGGGRVGGRQAALCPQGKPAQPAKTARARAAATVTPGPGLVPTASTASMARAIDPRPAGRARRPRDTGSPPAAPSGR
jgi:hypothetical protein